MDNPEECIKLITGDVLITKNPCGHRGDIRQAKAIGKSHPAYEKLRHLVNVIVFPCRGSRPLQNMMSGGDLDGDVYMIMWDKDLVQGAKKGYPDKKAAEKREKERSKGHGAVNGQSRPDA
jgi:RNA-dependent RNA polymerase